MNFVFSADNRVKAKKNEKLERYIDLVRELKNLWNMKVKVILIIVDVLEHSQKTWKRD